MTFYKRIVNKRLPGFCFSITDKTDPSDLYKICEETPNCFGFDTKGRLLFFVPESELIDCPGTDTYIDVMKHYEMMKLQKVPGNIPKRVHFIWFSKGRPFNLVNYIAVRAVMFHCSDYEVYLHCDKEPQENIYYDDLRRKGLIREEFEEVRVMNGHPVIHFQHRCDIVRLRILKEFGGIYMDLDNIILKPLDVFLDKTMVMGYERKNHKGFIANGVIMVEKGNPMIDEWLWIYEKSWGEKFVPNWNGHSIRIPYQLSFKYRHLLSVQPKHVFYPFLWDDMSILSKSSDSGKTYEDSWSVQLWETESTKVDHLLPITPLYFSHYNNCFTRLFGNLMEGFTIEDDGDDFVVIDGYDTMGRDIKCVGRQSPEVLKKVCRQTEGAVCINSLGFVKSGVDLSRLIAFSKRPYCRSQDKLYILKEKIERFW